MPGVVSQEADLLCLLRAGAGDVRALAEMFDRHTPRMLAVAVAMLGDPREAEEQLRETWLQVWTRSRTYDRTDGPVAAWLLSLLRGRLIERLRERPAPQEAEKFAREAAGPKAPPAALAALSPLERQALEATFLRGFQPPRLAGHLEVEPAVARDLLRRGLEALAPEPAGVRR